MKIIGIYKITSPSKKVYIGKSINCNFRQYQYSRGNCKGQTKLYYSILKYGWRNHHFDVIHICMPDELDMFEKYYIKLFQCYNSKFGLNLTEGGEGTVGRICSDITKQILRHKNLGRKYSKETKEKHRKLMLGNKINLNREFSEEAKLNMKLSHQNISKETRDKMSNTRKRLGLKPPSFLGKSRSSKDREQIKQRMMGNKNNLGNYHSEEALKNMRHPNNKINNKKKETFVCIHCNKEVVGVTNLKRWHNNNCKSLINNTVSV